MSDVEPLRCIYLSPLGELAKLFADIPIVGVNARRHRELVAILKRRGPEVLGLWGDDVERLRFVCLISPILKEYGRWPNALFVPEDHMRVLLWDPTMELLDVEAIAVLGDQLAVSAEEIAELIDRCYGEFVDEIRRKGSPVFRSRGTKMSPH